MSLNYNLHGALGAALTIAAWVLPGCSDRVERAAAPQEQAASANAASLQIGSAAWRSLPPAIRARRITALQAAAGPELALAKARPGVFSAHNDAMALHMAFEPGRVSVLSAAGQSEPSAPIELAAAAWGCSSAMSDVQSAEPVASAEHANRVSYAHAGFDEWYSVGAAGLEQGFKISALPECVKPGVPLRIRLRFSDAEGANSKVDPDTGEALLTTPGRGSVRYGEAFAEDAAGVQHAVRLIGGSEPFALEIDAAGAALPLLIDPLIYQARQTILASDFQINGYAANDLFGGALSATADVLLVGTNGDRAKGLNAGAAYFLSRRPQAAFGLGTPWAPLQKVTAADGAAADSFGTSVALTSDTALVGAPSADAAGVDSGAAYVFTHGAAWTQQQELTPLDAHAGDRFGFSVALAGDTAVVGAPLQGAVGFEEVGAAYVFVRSGGVWVQQRKLTLSPLVLQSGLHFGAAVAISGDTVAIGRDSSNGGGVDWFTRKGQVWSNSGATLTGGAGHFGSALAMNDATTVIGAYGDATHGVDSGSVSLVGTPAPHAALATLSASNGQAGDQFGFAVAMSSTSILVGAPASAKGAGSAYVFVSNGGVWSQLALLSGGSRSGAALAISGSSSMLVGSPTYSLWAVKMGAVGVYDYGLNNGSPCTAATECVEGHCADGVCCDTTCTEGCWSCLNAFTGVSTGSCRHIKANMDPKNFCANMGTVCGTTDNCDGNGGCGLANPTGTPCGGSQPLCASATSTAAQFTCSTASCVATPAACTPGYLCKAGACKVSCASDSDCDGSKGFTCFAGSCKQAAGLSCTSSDDCATGACGFGVCCTPIAPYGCSTPPGALCATNDECYTHHCVDGVCCDSACDGACESCALNGNEGICTPATNDPADPPGSCAPAGGSGGEAGVGGGSAGTGGVNQSSGGTGGGGVSGAGISGAAASGGVSGVSGASAGAGANSGGAGGTSGQTATGGDAAQAGAELCSKPCSNGLVCNPHTGACADELVTACGCRAAGGRGNPLSALSLLALLGLGLATRRGKSNANRRPRRAQS